MAVIITDMNIPKTCGKCFLRCKVGDYRAPVYRCSITGEIIDFSDYISYKQSNCPLKSADEMLNYCKEAIEKMNDAENFREVSDITKNLVLIYDAIQELKYESRQSLKRREINDCTKLAIQGLIMELEELLH